MFKLSVFEKMSRYFCRPALRYFKVIIGPLQLDVAQGLHVSNSGTDLDLRHQAVTCMIKAN